MLPSHIFSLTHGMGSEPPLRRWASPNVIMPFVPMLMASSVSPYHGKLQPSVTS